MTIFLTTQYLEEADQLAAHRRPARRRTPGRGGHARRAQGPGRRRDARRRVPGAHRPRRHHRHRRPRRERRQPPMTTMTYAARDSATMLRRNLKHLVRYPSLTLMIIGDAGGVPAAVRLRLRRHHGRRAARRGRQRRPAGRLPAYITPAILVMTVASVAQQHRDPGREGRDRGDHRPVPDDADRPVGAADRPRAGRDGADGLRRARRPGHRARARLPQ